jgi:hypothetical protein
MQAISFARDAPERFGVGMQKSNRADRYTWPRAVPRLITIATELVTRLDVQPLTSGGTVFEIEIRAHDGRVVLRFLER